MTDNTEPAINDDAIIGDWLKKSNTSRIINDYNSNHFNLLKNDTDKVKNLVKLISPNLPTRKLLASMQANTNNNEDYNLTDAEAIVNHQIQLEEIYITSLFSDITNRTHTPTTDLLRQSVVDGFANIITLSQVDTQISEIKRGTNLMITDFIDNKIAEIATKLNLGKAGKTSFLDKLF